MYNVGSYIVILALSVSIGMYINPERQLSKKELLRSYEAIASTVTVAPDSRVVLGTNVNLDRVADATSFLRLLNVSANENGMKDEGSVGTKDQLASVFNHFFSTSSAAERVVSDDGLWNEMLKVSHDMDHTEMIGGNAALMAVQFAKSGVKQPIVAGPVGSSVHQLLTREHVFVADEILGATISSSKADDVHLILEYKAGDVWAGVKATRSNRFILTRDYNNARLTGLEALEASLTIANPQAIVLSGIHLLEVWSHEDRAVRLGSVISKVLARESPKTLVHLELASMASQQFVLQVAGTLFEHFDSIGLNEQELASLYEALGGRFSDSSSSLEAVADPVPQDCSNLAFKRSAVTGEQADIQAITNAVGLIFHKQKGGKLTRVHVHSYVYHLVVIQKQQAGARSRWTGVEASLAAGSMTATLKACGVEGEQGLHGNDLDLKGKIDFKVDGSTLQIKPSQTIGHWSRAASNLHFYAAHVLICKKPKLTVGLGDAISAAALAKEL